MLAPGWVIILLAIVYGVCAFGTVYFTALTTSSDPTDPTVAEEREFMRRRKEQGDLSLRFDTSVYDYYCAICNTHVLENSKHCKACNRCTQIFDHHCNLVNNDIGLLNYRLFAKMIGTAFVFLLVSVAIGVYFLVFLFNLKYSKTLESTLQKAALDYVVETFRP